MSDIRVLIVEDDRRTASAHAQYVERVDGFVVTAMAHTIADARRVLDASRRATHPIELVLLDVNLPDGQGLDLWREVRAAGMSIDVIAVTAVRELDTVRQAVAVGVAHYVLKPFTFETFAAKLGAYRDYYMRMRQSDRPLSQHDVDATFAALRTSNRPGLPKGLSAETLDEIRQRVLESDRGWSAAEVAAQIGTSRVTARRYLEHLCEEGSLVRGSRHGGRGRPEVDYRRV